MTWVKNKTTKLTIMSIKIGIGKLRIGTGGGQSWASYWSSQTPETNTGSFAMSDRFVGTTIDTDKWEVTDPADGVTISQNGTLIFTINRANPIASTNTNPVDSKKSITSGFAQFTLGGTAVPADSTRVASLFSSISVPAYSAQILNHSVSGYAMLRIYSNNSKVYEFVSSIDFKNTWRIYFDSATNEVKFYYLSAFGHWTQVGTTQIYEIDNGSGLKVRFGTTSFAGEGTMTYTVDNFIMGKEPTITVISDNLLIANDPAHPATRWYGRPVLKRLADKIWMMVYANSQSHNNLTNSQLHVRFSDDYGETWTDQNKYLDGSVVTGFPMFPPTCVPGVNNRGPGEGYIYQCPISPNHLIIHMWDSNYNNIVNGTWQSKSIDGGKTWSTPAKIAWINNTGITHDDERCFSTDDSFFYDGVIYAGVREYETDAITTAIRVWIAKSEDNGTTWELVSLLSTFADGTQEIGIEHVGNNAIIACIRGNWGPAAYYSKSTDMGLTWEPLSQVQALYDVWGRNRIYTRSHIKGTNNWWDDPVLICHSFVFVDGETGESNPRRLAVWISFDKGELFLGPYYLKEQGFDGGYGDLLYNPIKDEYVTLQYYAPTSLYDGEIRQINWKLTL